MIEDAEFTEGEPLENKRLIEARIAKGWTQKIFAKKMDVSVDSIHRWEHYESFPQPDSIEKLCKLLSPDPKYPLKPSELGLISREDYKRMQNSQTHPKGKQITSPPLDYLPSTSAENDEQIQVVAPLELTPETESENETVAPDLNQVNMPRRYINRPMVGVIGILALLVVLSGILGVTHLWMQYPLKSTIVGSPTVVETIVTSPSPTPIHEDTIEVNKDIRCFPCEFEEQSLHLKDIEIDFDDTTTTFTLLVTNNSAEGFGMRGNFTVTDQHGGRICFIYRSADDFFIKPHRTIPIKPAFKFTPKPGDEYTLFIEITNSGNWRNVYNLHPIPFPTPSVFKSLNCFV